MNKILTVFKYELKSTLKSKTFIVSTLIFVAIILAGSLMFRFGFSDMGQGFQEQFSEYIPSQTGESHLEHIGVVTEDSDYDTKTLKDIFKNYRITEYSSEEEMKKSISNHEVDAGLSFKNENNIKVIYDKAPTFGVGIDRYSETLKEYLVDQKLQERGITLQEINEIEYNVKINTEVESLRGDTSIATGIGTFLSMMIYIMILMNGQIASMNVAREKNDRTMELLITSTDSRNLIHGKVLASFVQSIVTLLAVVVSVIVGLIINKDSIDTLLETLSKLNFTLDPIVILIFLAFFIVGYILYLYIYAALGATVSNTEEINTALGPIMIIVVLVYLATVFALSLPDPDNIVLKILSFIPFSSMFVIHTRYAITDMTLMEVGISFGILLVTTLILSAISVRIYRSASLNYGNRDKLSNKIRKKFKRK